MRRGDVSSCSRAEGRRSEDTRPFSGAQADRATDESGPAPLHPEQPSHLRQDPPALPRLGPGGRHGPTRSPSSAPVA